MKKYSLTIKENKEYGRLGIVVDTGRNYFEPAVDGLVVAHDILEHTIKPHPNGYIDELMAIGGFIAGRLDSGWSNEHSGRINHAVLAMNIRSLAISALENDERLCPKSSKNHLQSSGTMDEIRSFVRKGIIYAINEYEDKEYQYIPLKYSFDIESICGWICKGHQLFNRRFYNLDKYTLSTYFFDKITAICDNWIKGASEYETAKLFLNFSSYGAKLVVDEEY